MLTTGRTVAAEQAVLAQLDSVGILTAMLGALAPAVVAARREPLHELRVP